MSQLEVDKIIPQSGTTLTLGDTGDTINFGSGVLPNFENLTVTGDFTVDTNSLKVDSTNNRVGIGTASPSVALDVVGAITASGNITGTLATASQPNITSVGTLTGLTVSGNIAGTLTTASQPNITSVGTLTSFTSTGIDDNATSTAITIDSSENVGINTSSPTEKLTVSGDMNVVSSSTYKIKSQVSSSYSLNLGHDRIQIVNGASNPFLFYYGSTERMRIDSSGNVGIGTSSPSAKLHVADNIKGDGNFSLGTLPSGASSSSYRQAQISLANFSDSGGNNSATFWHQNGYIGSGNNSYAVTSGTGTSHASRLGMSSGVLTYSNAYPVTADTQISFSERFRIASNGNVGIGTTSPVGKLDVAGSIYCDGLQVDGNAVIQQTTGDVSLTLQANENGSNREPRLNLKGYNTSSNPTISFGDNDGYAGYIEYENADNSMRLWTNGSERMRITSGGQIWMRTTSTSLTNATQVVFHPGSSEYGIRINSTGTSGTQYHQSFDRGQTQAGYITSNSATTIAFNNASDERLKENIQNSGSAIQDIKDIQVRQFDWIDAIDTHRDFGFVAQELINVVPEAVTQGTDELDENGKPVRSWGVDYSHIVPRLVKVCQEQQTKIEELEARITALENA